jgi:hypothetical protein
MISYCPYCGFHIKRPLCNGITSCNNCNRTFDTCPFNRILSASWMARKQHLMDVDLLLQYDYTVEETDLVYTYIIEQCRSHEYFVKVLTDLGISKYITV